MGWQIPHQLMFLQHHREKKEKFKHSELLKHTIVSDTNRTCVGISSYKEMQINNAMKKTAFEYSCKEDQSDFNCHIQIYIKVP